MGIDRPMPTDAAREAAKKLSGMTSPINARQRLAGVRLVATDSDVAAGEGHEVRVPIGDTVIILAGWAQP